jgi:hypothetical protein
MATSSLQCSSSRAAAARPQACRRRVQLSVQAARWVVVGFRRSQLCIAFTLDLILVLTINHVYVLSVPMSAGSAVADCPWDRFVLASALLPLV